MKRQELGPIITPGQLSRLRTIIAQLDRSASLLDLARPEVATLLRDIDGENRDCEVLFNSSEQLEGE